MTTFELEQPYWDQGRVVVGVDEVGRGSLAGPVVVSAVVFAPNQPILKELNDSKQLTPNRRNYICCKVQATAQAYTVTCRSARLIDQSNILKATLDAMRQAVQRVVHENQLENPMVLVDGNKAIPDLGFEQICVVKGDTKSQSIAAASNVAKVFRDDFMAHLDKLTGYTYGFERHKGYPTKQHYTALKEHGNCGYHRQTFRLGPKKNV